MSDFTSQLYPFLRPAEDAAATQAALVAEVRTSTLLKARDVAALRSQLATEYSDSVIDCATAMANAFARGGKLLAFGNGGSATDAQDVAADCMAAPVPGWRSLPALALVNDTAIVTAIANDVGVENVFLRQIIAYGEQGDIALGISTSGNSPNVVAALSEARRHGLLTIVFTGNEGGELARPGVADFCFVSRVAHIPRIQEGHATIWHVLLELVQEILRDTDEGAPQ